jgi:Alpha amylase, C-terminal all-beta domain
MPSECKRAEVRSGLQRGDLVFVFNFHPTNSYTDYRIGCFHPGPYKIALSSDEEPYGGFRNVTKDSDVEFFAGLGEHDNRPNSFQARPPLLHGLCGAARRRSAPLRSAWPCFTGVCTRALSQTMPCLLCS